MLDTLKTTFSSNLQNEMWCPECWIESVLAMEWPQTAQIPISQVFTTPMPNIPEITTPSITLPPIVEEPVNEIENEN